jgi:hypothetical protein
VIATDTACFALPRLMGDHPTFANQDEIGTQNDHCCVSLFGDVLAAIC